ncbi:unnamed protein product [Sphenostylis stenocarpa]|uniref:Uncharacterized protein n=1 Tax=Sphenostylis stenocarpa TaxID=92480 RepID=A0AA86VZK7_9FABA|nr:unnamed protein product [Sphenostylis stenocarpa]
MRATVACDTETITYGPLVMILLWWRVRWLSPWAETSSEWNLIVSHVTQRRRRSEKMSMFSNYRALMIFKSRSP